jgi:hypothetical protein
MAGVAVDAAVGAGRRMTRSASTARPQTGVVVFRRSRGLDEALGVGDVRRELQRRRVTVPDDLVVHEDAVARPEHVGEDPPVVVTTNDVAFQTHGGPRIEERLCERRGFRTEAFDRRVGPFRLGCVDTDQPDPLVVAVDRHIDRVAVDDELDHRVGLSDGFGTRARGSFAGRVGTGTNDPDWDPSPQPTTHVSFSIGVMSATRLTRRNRGVQTDEFRSAVVSDALTDRSTDISKALSIEPPKETR